MILVHHAQSYQKPCGYGLVLQHYLPFDHYAYSDVPIVTLGSAQVWVEYDGRRLCLPVAVVRSQDAALFGFDWCRAYNMPLPKGVKLCTVTPKCVPNAQQCTWHDLERVCRSLWHIEAQIDERLPSENSYWRNCRAKSFSSTRSSVSLLSVPLL